MKMSVKKRDANTLSDMSRDEQGMVLAAVIILLLFAFLLTTAALAFVYSSNLTTFSKEHHMISLERAEAGLNKGALDMITLLADLPEEITLPTGYSHADYVEFLDGLDDTYYVEDTSGDYRYYLTDDEAIVGYGWQQNFKRIVRCEYSDYYFPVMETPPRCISTRTLSTAHTTATYSRLTVMITLSTAGTSGLGSTNTAS